MNLYRDRTFKLFSGLVLILSLVGIAIAQNGNTTSSSGATAQDDGWHFQATPYLWFAGVHGAAGVDGHLTSIHASFGDILSNLNIGLMGEVEARRKRVLLSTDLMWM